MNRGDIRQYSEEETQKVITLYNLGKPPTEIAKELVGRSAKSVSVKLSQLRSKGLVGYTGWGLTKIRGNPRAQTGLPPRPTIKFRPVIHVPIGYFDFIPCEAPIGDFLEGP